MDTLASDGYQNDIALSIYFCSRGVCRDVYIVTRYIYVEKKKDAKPELSDDDDI